MKIVSEDGMGRRCRSNRTMTMKVDALLTLRYLHLLLIYDVLSGRVAIVVQYPDKYAVSHTEIQKGSCVRGLPRHQKTLVEHLADRKTCGCYKD